MNDFGCAALKKMHNTCGVKTVLFGRYLPKNVVFTPQVFLYLFGLKCEGN